MKKILTSVSPPKSGLARNHYFIRMRISVIILFFIVMGLMSITGCAADNSATPSSDTAKGAVAVALPEMENSSNVSYTFRDFSGMHYLIVAGYRGGIVVVNLTNDSLQNLLLTKQLH